MFALIASFKCDDDMMIEQTQAFPLSFENVLIETLERDNDWNERDTKL